MFLNNDKISTPHMINIMILNMVGVGILTLPRDLTEGAGTDGWIILIIGGLVTMGFSALYGYIVKSFPGKSYFEIASLTLTKPIAYLVGIYFTIYFIGMTAFVTRIFVDVIRTYVLVRTPKEVILLSILFLAVYLNRKGIEVLGRLAELLIIPLAVAIFLLFAVSWGKFEAANLLPIFQISFKEVLQGIPLVFFSFLGFEVILVFGMFLNQPKKSVKAAPIAVFVVLLLYLLINTSVMGNFGDNQVQRLIWPLLTNFENVDLPGAFIENVGVVVMSVWVFTVFTTISPMYLAGNLLIAQLLQGREHNYIALSLMPVIYLVSQWSDSVSDTYQYVEMLTNYIGYGVMIIIPMVILLITVVKGRHRKEEGR
ncbi:GerAB/ArcD/ProY family transporter [Clostridium formicaceticum]|uniref:Spore germination protein YndE n=2 Tax=Clostridium formicaceticum TaxID=1497 RepID=A0AAC9RR85_9CLOT|nr:endospore germination permease [Clostridium formicaceticum]AOY75179.1 hypothetical protein BJL90_04225 [Clostridium formicaceticum]ARE89605.1 Spore germination protein YndE [Clostridium formicaceticum]